MNSASPRVDNCREIGPSKSDGVSNKNPIKPRRIKSTASATPQTFGSAFDFARSSPSRCDRSCGESFRPTAPTVPFSKPRERHRERSSAWLSHRGPSWGISDDVVHRSSRLRTSHYFLLVRSVTFARPLIESLKPPGEGNIIHANRGSPCASRCVRCASGAPSGKPRRRPPHRYTIMRPLLRAPHLHIRNFARSGSAVPQPRHPRASYHHPVAFDALAMTSRNLAFAFVRELRARARTGRMNK